ncbi:unnamed protein product [Clonostachys byssicola]|uniref:Zn(2)-C6 fungal-type domain-containing protein n=1 Tax=Clonostachys byssicola TaxID=160290 RepID=A0A9N9U634_9HYPO|nr:unnamed protein product [Clonostachys byssicola]
MELCRAPSSPQGLRKTCDHCRKRKIKCSNETPCTRCQRFGLLCRYSPTRPIGRPSKRQATPPSNPRSTSLCPQSSGLSSFCRNEPSEFEHLNVPGGLADDAMTLDALGAPMTFPTPPDDLSWSEWSALDTIINNAHPFAGSCQDQLLQVHNKPRGDGCISNADEALSQVHEHTHADTQCQCGKFVKDHMNTKKTDIDDLLEFIMAQRKSRDLAQQVLTCTSCGNLDSLPSQVAGNVLLFGAVMMDALLLYQKFTREQRHRALASPDDQCAKKIYLASTGPGCQQLDFQLEQRHAWPLAKALLRIEVDQLNRMCTAFVARQWQVHEKGHEMCSSGAVCKKPKSPTPSFPADSCPRSIEPTAFFNCFRTAKHLQSLIESVQKDLE